MNTTDTVKYVESEAEFQSEAAKILTHENLKNMAPVKDEPFFPTPFCPTCGRQPRPEQRDTTQPKVGGLKHTQDVLRQTTIQLDEQRRKYAKVWEQRHDYKAHAQRLAEALKRLYGVADDRLDQSATHEGLENCEALAMARKALAELEGAQ